MLKSEKVSSKETSYEDLLFLKRLFPKFDRKKLWSLTNPFFDIFVIFQIFSSFLNNYPANSEIKCLTEKKSVIRFLSAPMTMPCLLKKKMPKKVFPFFG